MTVVVAAVAALGVTAVPSFADHGGPAGVCGVATTNGVVVEQDSTVVTTLVPPGPGLRVSVTMHCNSGNASEPSPLNIIVKYQGVHIGALTTQFDAPASPSSTRTLSLHLPVSATQEVCVEVNGQERCVPPSE